MNVISFSRTLFTAALIASLSGCAQLEHKGSLHAPEKTNDAMSWRQTSPENEGRAVWIHATIFSQDRAGADGVAFFIATSLKGEFVTNLKDGVLKQK